MCVPLSSPYVFQIYIYIFVLQGSDLKSTTRLVQTIIELEYDARDYVQLNSSINVLSKKHGQLKGAIQGMVELAMSWLDEIKQRDGVETWLELVETLRTVTEGKVRRPLASYTAAALPVLMHHTTYPALLGDTAGPRDALPRPPPRGVVSESQIEIEIANSPRLSYHGLRPAVGPSGGDVLLDGTRREDQVHLGADAFTSGGGTTERRGESECWQRREDHAQ